MARTFFRTAALAGGLGALLLANDANARVVIDERYPPEVTWNAMLRLLRVDMGFPITERDRESGFVLFTWRDTSARGSPGSVELVPTTVEGIPGTRVIIQLAAMPQYAERLILTRLSRKLREEYGEPRSAPRTNPTDRPTAPADREHEREQQRNRDGDQDRNRTRENDAALNRERSGETSREGNRDNDRNNDRNER